jgi:hypothetical protein
MELCPKIMKSGEKLGFLGVSEFWGETMKMRVKKGRRWCGGEWWWLRDAAVVMGRCLGGGFLDVREFGRRESAEEVGESGVRRGGEVRREGKVT